MNPVLQWLPGESLFSLCSRYHQIAASHTPARTCQLLFGSNRTGSAHDVPANVNALVSRSYEPLGNAIEIIIKRSLIPFYFPFHSSSRCAHWISQIREGSAPNLKIQMGLAASRFGMSHPLKACPECMSSDAFKFGIGYWHVIHQLPGVYVCPTHGKTLLTATDKVSGKDRFDWVLPEQANFEIYFDQQEQLSLAPRLAEAAEAIWNLPTDFTFNISQLTDLYRNQLVHLDFLDLKSGKFNTPKFEKRLNLIIRNSGFSLAFPWLTSGEGASTFANRLLRMTHLSSPRESRHPLNHLCLILLLFDSWETFWERHKRIHAVAFDDACPGKKCTEDLPSISFNSGSATRLSCIEAIHAGQSVTSIAKLHGIAVVTVMSWAAKEGITSPRRPKLLHLELRKRVISMLSRGSDKAQVATKFGVSIQTITRVLMTEPGLSNLWTDARFARAQKLARKAWLNTMSCFPTASSVQWRNLEPSSYAWLYRNDRGWLQNSIRSRPNPVNASNSRLNWEYRDEKFAQAVRVAALNSSLYHPEKRLTLGELCSIVKGLREKLSVLNKLPLTQTAIQDACSAKRVASCNSLCSFDETGMN